MYGLERSSGLRQIQIDFCSLTPVVLLFRMLLDVVIVTVDRGARRLLRWDICTSLDNNNLSSGSRR